ncbi:HipA family kinase [Bradyrhizobium sp. 5.13L]
MLFCGAHWQPATIRRVIETFQTSTRIARVATDAGNGFLKGLGNPAGSMSLAAELVAAELANWFGLPIPSFARVPVTSDLQIPMIDGGQFQLGPAFISKEVDGFSGPGGLSRLTNPDDVSRLVVFDTWIRNTDRCAPIETGYPPNYDNLFFTKSGSRFQLTALDHSHAFVENGLEGSLSDPYVLTDEGIYGYFPDFASLIKFSAVTTAVDRLHQVTPAMANEIVASIPLEWQISAGARASWANVITVRAQRVAEYLPAKLLNDPGLGL